MPGAYADASKAYSPKNLVRWRRTLAYPLGAGFVT
jgi:hypothetical protein